MQNNKKGQQDVQSKIFFRLRKNLVITHILLDT